MLLTSSDTLRLVTASAVTVDVTVDYRDEGWPGIVDGSTNTAITGATTTSILAAPGVQYKRRLMGCTIRNKHAASSNAVTVQVWNGTTAYEKIKATLLAGEQLIFSEDQGWYVLDATGGAKTAPAAGRLLARSLIAASGNLTTQMGTAKMLVKGVAGGGGGGGTTNVAGSVAAGGGGGAGGYVEKLFTVAPNTAYAFVCGAAGAGVAGNAGGNGADSTVVVAGVTVTAKGGTGAPQATSVNTTSAYAGGAGGTVSTNGDVNVCGQPGLPGIIALVAGNLGCSGTGGSGPLGQGGLGRATAGDGAAGTGYGAGGAGSLSAAATEETGGNGTAGAWIVEEYA